MKVRLWVKEHYDRFYDKDEALSTWTQKRRDRHTPKPSMRISGPGSIMEALFLTPNVTGRDNTQYLQIADYMVSFDVSSCDVERAGSYMTGGLTPSRSTLGPLPFATLVFLSFNLPHLHEIDLSILVEAWRKSGHMLPIPKNGAESRVLARLRARESPTFLFKKNDYLPGPDDNFDWITKRAFEDTAPGADSGSDDGDDSDDDS